MSNQNAEAPVMVGGWSTYHDLTPKEKEVFDVAIKNILGVKYTPETVSTQVVNGTNYRYKCKASLPQGGQPWDAIVEIYAPLEGAPYVTGIQRV